MKQYIQSQDLQTQVGNISHHAFYKKDSYLQDQNLYFVKQVHGNRVINYDDFSTSIVEADAIVTNRINITLAIKTADCVPVVLIDPHSYVIGIAHAGWKGAQAGIIANTIKKMVSIGAKSHDIIAAIGPCIRQTSYEVRSDFRQNFSNDDDDLFIPSKNPEHYMFDLPAYVKRQLSGIKMVYDCQVDTYSNRKDFASNRLATHQNRIINVRNISTIKLLNSIEGIDEWQASLRNVKKHDQDKKIYYQKETPISIEKTQSDINNVNISPILDLHGYTSMEAYEELCTFIKQHYKKNNRSLLIITGKGAGIIRENVHKWLQYSKLNQYILKFQHARPQDGGEGALYVTLKK